jgi:hypothetical protein
MDDRRVKQIAEERGLAVDVVAAAVQAIADRLALATVPEAAEAFRDNLDAAGPIECLDCHQVSDGERWATLRSSWGSRRRSWIAAATTARRSTAVLSFPRFSREWAR